MKRSIKFLVFCGMASIFIINVFTVSITTTNGDSNLSSLITAFAQSENPDDERNVVEICVKPCPGGGSAGGALVNCKTGYIDCTPQDCNAECGTEV